MEKVECGQLFVVTSSWLLAYWCFVIRNVKEPFDDIRAHKKATKNSLLLKQSFSMKNHWSLLPDMCYQTYAKSWLIIWVSSMNYSKILLHVHVACSHTTTPLMLCDKQGQHLIKGFFYNLFLFPFEYVCHQLWGWCCKLLRKSAFAKTNATLMSLRFCSILGC